jgi:hypothetical protein
MQLPGKNSDDITKGIQVPEGWEVSVEINPNNASELQQFESLKKKIALYLPFVTKRVEIFKARALRNYHIAIQSTFIYVDADGSFEVVLNVNKDEFHAPDMVGLRIDAKEYLQDIPDMNMRLKFAISEEQNRFSLARRPYKLRYSYGTPSFFRKAS